MLHGGGRLLYEHGLSTASDPGDFVVEKADLERALSRAGLTDKQRAFGSLLAMGYTIGSAARVLGLHGEDARRLVTGSEQQPGLAARLEAILNGGEDAP